jgi:membrane protease YdiL (CAAX protease family)
MCWALLLLIAVAEYLTAAVHPQLGLALHALLLIGLLVWSGFGPRPAERRLALGLLLAPLIRLLSVGLPLPALPQLAWYPAVGVPLLAATWIIVRQAGLGRRALGLRQGNLVFELALMAGGFTLGAAEYAILRPEPSFGAMNGWYFFLAALVLLVFTGFTEELIFRGVLQTLALPILGRSALIYVSLLFGALHIGHLSIGDLVFVTLVALLFGQIARREGSILGVTIAHGITNLTLFVIMPYLHRDRPDLVPYFIAGPLAIGTALSVGALGLLALRSAEAGILAAGSEPIRPHYDEARVQLRAMLSEGRRSRQLSFNDLARLTGIDARRLVAFEFGIAGPDPAELQRIARELELVPQQLAVAFAAAHQSA